MILSDTAERNDGMCAQCVKDPDGAQFQAEFTENFSDATLVDFKRELSRAVTESVQHIVDYYGDEGIYGFALHSCGDYVYVTDTVFTELGLQQVAERYFAKEYYRETYGSVGEVAKQLRWSPGDAPAHSEREEIFKIPTEMMGWQWGRIDGLQDDHVSPASPSLQLCNSFECIMLEVLGELRSSNLLPNEVFIGFMMGDQSIAERVAYAELFNSLEVAQRFVDEQCYPVEPEGLELCRSRIKENLKNGYDGSEAVM